jgi:hypothetical protein
MLLLAVGHRATATAASRRQNRCQPCGNDPAAISLALCFASSFASSIASSSPTLSTTSIAAASSLSSAAAAMRRHITEDKRHVPDSLGTVLVQG